MSYIQPNEEYIKKRSKKFARRILLLRQLGTTLCFISFAPVLYLNDYSVWAFILLFMNAFIWPVTAYVYSIKQENLIRSTFKTLILDATYGGAWVAIMGLNPLPSLIIIAILVSDRYAAGGWLLLKPSLISMIVAFALAWTALGFPIYLSFQPMIIWASLPLATIYIIALSIVSRHLSESLSQRNIEFEKIALMDPRLQIPNRRLFEQRLSSTFIESQAKRQQSYLLLIDVDHFKNINDTFGHEMGDLLLEQLSMILRKVVSTRDIPARFGGDELAVIVIDSSEVDIFYLAHQIKDQFTYLSTQLQNNCIVTISIGIASTNIANSASEWFRYADTALYEVKKSGRNGIKLFQI